MTADTQPLAPTDAEIDAAWRESVARHETTSAFVRDFARAVLAKWGAQPVPASAAEFALQALVAAGHVSQELVNQAMALPGAPARPVVPAGYALVPVEPTPEMLAEVDEEVGGHCYSCTRWKASYDDCQRIWAAMLAAAPQPVAREPLTDEQIRELWSTRSLHALEFARAIESAHGITTNGRKDAP